MVTVKNYYEEKEHFSNSEFKRYYKCEFDGQLRIPIEVNTAMLIGSYVDAYVEETIDQFTIDHPEIFSTRGTTKGELKKDFQKADEICNYIDQNKVFKQFMSGQKQTIMTGEIEGVPYKIKMDSYSPSIAINDLKVLASVTNKDGIFKDFITPWGYDFQLAGYQEIVRQKTGEKLPCYICAVTKEDPIDSVIVKIDQVYLDKALYKIQSLLPRYQEIKTGITQPESCGICKTCVANRTETPIISLEQIINNY